MVLGAILTRLAMAVTMPFTEALVISMRAEPVFFSNATMWVELIENEFRSNPTIRLLIVSVAKLMLSITNV